MFGFYRLYYLSLMMIGDVEMTLTGHQKDNFLSSQILKRKEHLMPE